MPAYTVSYYGQPGFSYMQDPALAYAEILQVARGPAVYRYWPSLSVDPPNQYFGYDMGIGKFLFDPNYPFLGDPGDVTTWERITIIYKV